MYTNIVTGAKYCYECTGNEHCSSGELCTNYACVAGPTCHASCKTCDGTSNSDCLTCDNSGSYPNMYTSLSGKYCYECTADSHCPTNFECDTNSGFGSYTCKAGPTCHASCKTCDGTDEWDCLTCDDSGSFPHMLDAYDGGDYCYECTENEHCPSNFKCNKPLSGPYTCTNAACSGSMPCLLYTSPSPRD